MFMIDPNKELPLYAQIKAELRQLIENGDLEPGTRLPSEKDLASEFDVSTITVKRAVLDLVREGLITRQRGKGTFVVGPKLERNLVDLTSFTDEMLHRGLTPGNKLLNISIIPAKGRVASTLQIELAEEVIFIERVRLIEGDPLMIERTYLPHHLYPGLIEKFQTQSSLYKLMTQEYGIGIVEARQTLEPVLVDRVESSVLNVMPGSPALLIELTSFSENDCPVEYTKGLVRGDRCKYYIKMGGLREFGFIRTHEADLVTSEISP